MTRADRTSIAGARYLDLQRKARQSGRPTDDLIQLNALECFLDRLTRSAFASHLVFKGGVLLAALDARRPTRDIDLAASSLRNTETEILAVVREIAAISLDDGMAFDPADFTVGQSAMGSMRCCRLRDAKVELQALVRKRQQRLEHLAHFHASRR
jgi:hypothetical protein